MRITRQPAGASARDSTATPLCRWVPLGILAIAVAIAVPVQAATLEISNASDIVNGDASSPAALAANPGPDGISLREATLAANAAIGPHNIRFASALAGQTIVLANGLSISRSGVALTGLANPDSTPAVTLDGVNISPGVILTVTASDVSVSHLRFTRINSAFAIQIRAGLYFGTQGPQTMQNIQIEDNAFSNPGSSGSSLAVSIGMETSTSNASLSNVLIARNAFTDFSGEATAVHIQAGGAENVIHDVTVRDNTFTRVTFGVELVAANASSSRIERVNIVTNTFTDNLQPVNLNHIGTPGESATSGNVVDDTWIAGNVFSGNRGPAIVLLGGMSNATENTISNTRIVNNVISGSTQYGGVGIAGGRSGGTLGQINGVQIANNTIAQNVGGGVEANPDPERVGGNNTISGVTVINSIFYANSLDFYGVDAGQVSYSITAQGGFAGISGNISGDPLFANTAQGDFHLQAGSPAIDAASANGAPPRDQECRGRTDDPATPNNGIGTPPYIDIGAFEHAGGPVDCSSIVPSDVLVPTIPTGLTATVVGASQINLNWTASTDDIGVIHYKLHRNGALVTVLVGAPLATIYSDIGLAPSTAYTYTVAACDAAGNCSEQSPSTSAVTSANTATLDLSVGWNLLGNSSSGSLDVATAFGNTGDVLTAWKWIANSATWAFYAPSLVGQALIDYTGSKGYDVLTRINGGEGFWVNAKQPVSVDLPDGDAISVTTLGSALIKGWNLISVGEASTPKQFCDAPGSGITTLWAWDSTHSAWYFYAPSLDTSGNLGTYITSKGYLDFTANSKTLGPGVGFWVNKP